VELDFCNPHEVSATFLFQKAMRSVDEEEVRILLFPRGQPHEVPFETTLLRRLILGRNMAPEHQQVIRQWCSARQPAVPVVSEIEVAETVTV
jgi:hypothetical protein